MYVISSSQLLPHAACTTRTGLLLASVDLPVWYKTTPAHLCGHAQSHKVLPSVHLPGGGTDGAFSALLFQKKTDAGDGLQPHDSLQPCLAESDPTAFPALACSSLHAYAHTLVRRQAGVSQSVAVKHKLEVALRTSLSLLTVHCCFNSSMSKPAYMTEIFQTGFTEDILLFIDHHFVCFKQAFLTCCRHRQLAKLCGFDVVFMQMVF